MTEDKADVNARVAWSGVGLNLATNEPTQERCAPPSAPCSIDPPTACARRKWLTNSPASTPDPRFFDHQPGGCRSKSHVAGRDDSDQPAPARCSPAVIWLPE